MAIEARYGLLGEGGEEEEEDDGAHLHLHRSVTKGYGYVPPKRVTGWVNVVFILFAELVGTGILSLPYTFAKVGWLIGCLELVAFCLLSLFSGLLLHRLQEHFPGSITYGNLAMEVMGRGSGGEFYQAVIFTFVYVAFFGNLAISLLLSAQSLQNIFWDKKGICLYTYSAAAAAMLFPLTQLRSLHQVSFAGLGSTIAISVAIGLLMFQCYSTTDSDPSGRHFDMVNTDSTFTEAFSASTAAVFAFGGQGLYLETMSEMKDARKFKKSLFVSTFLIMVFYFLSTCSIYFTYGDAVKSNAMFELPDGAIKRVASFAVLIHVLVSYLLANQVICRAIHVRVSPLSVDKGDWLEKLHWLLITTSALVLSWAISNAIPFLSNLMGVIASLTTAPLTFGFPAFFYIVACKKLKREIGPLERVALWCMIVVSAILLLAGTFVNVLELKNVWSKVGTPFSCNNLT